MNVSGLFPIVVAALAILAAVGSAGAFLLDRGNKQRLVDLDADIARRNVRIEFLEDAEKRSKETADAHVHQISELKVEVATLTRFAKATEGPIRDLSELGATHHAAVMAGLATLATQNAALLAAAVTPRPTQ